MYDGSPPDSKEIRLGMGVCLPDTDKVITRNPLYLHLLIFRTLHN